MNLRELTYNAGERQTVPILHKYFQKIEEEREGNFQFILQGHYYSDTTEDILRKLQTNITHENV